MGEKVFLARATLSREGHLSVGACVCDIGAIALARCVLFSALERGAFNPHFLSHSCDDATATKAFVGGFVVPRADIGAGRHNSAPRLSLSKHIFREIQLGMGKISKPIISRTLNFDVNCSNHQKPCSFELNKLFFLSII